MSANTITIERQWIRNFNNSAFVDKENGGFRNTYAYQLFYGKTNDLYPDNIPDNYSRFWKGYSSLENDDIIDRLIGYLKAIGIKLSKANIQLHIEKNPDDIPKITKKTYYILRQLAHAEETLKLNNPFYDNSGDIFFLLRIQTLESVNGGQLNLFEDLELPELYKKISILPDGYSDDPIVKELFNKIETTNDSYFITGKAGTGKSTFIHHFAKETEKHVLLLAFTGIAAVSIGGQTIHSFFKFPLKPFLPEDDEITIFNKYSEKYSIIQSIDTIIIDEVSMLRSDLLEAIDYSLRKNGGDPAKVFGGKQIIFVGDIFQLPPVVESDDEVERIVFNNLYKSEYFFDSPAYQKLNTRYFEFTKSFRQKDDLEFVELLDKIRVCNSDNNTLNKINERVNSDYTTTLEEFTIMLTTTNAIANYENSKRLNELQTTLYSFNAEIDRIYPESKYPTKYILEIKKNAQVILIKNDPEGRWVNGTIAKVDFVSKDGIDVRLQNNQVCNLMPVTWENRKYKYDKENRKIVSEVIGSFTHYPIKLAWAITIHKSQGLTFDKTVIDFGTGAFVNGQVYTALSRCKTLSGIVIKNNVRDSDIISDPRIISFHETKSILNSLNITQID